MKKKLTKKQKGLVAKYKFQQIVGETLILMGLLIPVMPFWPLIQSELSFLLYPPKSEAAQTSLDSSLTYSQEDFRIIIPKIGVDAPIVANVDSTNYTEYMKALNFGAAQAKGTAKPGEGFGINQNMFIFAHSTLLLQNVSKYNAVFIFLRKLELGDKVGIVYKGKLWKYQVTSKRIVEAVDLKYLVDPSNEPMLTLQTCDPPGTNLKRLIVQAKPI